jgi:hypothetical protein
VNLSRRNILTSSGAAVLAVVTGDCKREVAGSSEQLPAATVPYIDVVARPTVTPVRQVGNNTCWAAVWTMLMAWREGRHLSTEEAVKRLGPTWVENFRQDKGLAAQTFTEQGFLEASRLQAKPPANYLPSVYVELLASHGPLWINTGDGILNHATLLVSAQTRTDGTVNFRFADPQRGEYITKSDATFFAEFEREARVIVDRKLNWDLRFQIFYW